MKEKIKELYAYREMVFSLVRRDLKGRYKGSILGFLWTFLNPLLQLIVYTLVFSIIMKSDIKDFHIFLFVALVPWIFFATCVSNGAGIIWREQDLVKKIYFPRQVLPIAFVTSQFVNMLLSFLIVILILFISGRVIKIDILIYLVLVLCIEYILALGMTFLISAITVYLRDLEHLLGILIIAWQFLTPIMYSENVIPKRLMPIFYLNPMTPIIITYRDILYYTRIPRLEFLIYGGIFSLLILVVGWKVFNVFQKYFAEEL